MTTRQIFTVTDFKRRWNGGNLNMRQLLNPLFYTRDVRHTDAKRQRKARQQAKDLRAARRLKTAYVPLCDVDRTVYIDRPGWDGNGRWEPRTQVIEIRPSYGSAYHRKVRESCDEVTEGDARYLRRAS